MSMLADMAGGATPGADAAVAANAAAANGVAADGAADATTTAAAASPPADWLVPDEYKANESVGKFVKDGKIDRDALLKGYVNAAELVGRDKIIVPKTDEEFAAVYDKLGRPKTGDEYVVVKPDKLPEGMEYDEEGEKFMRQFGHANGWNQKQFDSAYKTYFERQQGMMASYQQYDKEAAAKCSDDLKREHGQAFDGFVQAGGAALKQYADPDFYQFLSEKGLANDPRMARIFGRIGKELLGESQLKGGNGGEGLALSPAEWDRKIADFRDTHKEALRDQDHRDYRTRADELRKMYRDKHGEK